MQADPLAPAGAVAPSRMIPLDALRGLAVLLMVMSGVLPWGSLPDWMYHAQVPPPEMAFKPEVPGITWVDLVFPFFIFSMGAAIPLAYGRRIDRGERWWRIGWAILERGAGLLFFALFVQHLRPATLDGAMGVRSLLLGLMAFAVLMAIFVRTPKSWPSWSVLALRLLGWAVAGYLLWSYRTEKGDAFSWGRTDIIIAVLANLSVSGPLLWLASRRRPLFQVAAMGVVAALILASSKPGIASTIWHFSPWGALVDISFQKYLLVLIPGIIVGDRLASGGSDEGAQAWRGWLVCAIGLVLQPLVVVGLHQQWVEATTLAALGLCAIGCAVVAKNEGKLQSLASMGAAWLTIGLLLEPFEAGIKKDPSNFSYYFVTAGLACWLLASLTVLRRIDRRPAGMLALVGANALFAYVAMNNLVDPLLRLLGVEQAVANLGWSPWPMAGYAFAKTLAMAAIVALATKKAVLWRA